jgi:hypothetical protein
MNFDTMSFVQDATIDSKLLLYLFRHLNKFIVSINSLQLTTDQNRPVEMTKTEIDFDSFFG